MQKEAAINDQMVNSAWEAFGKFLEREKN